jgi:CheY-like chemotaxis protein
MIYAQQSIGIDVMKPPPPAPMPGQAAAVERHLRIIVVEDDALIGMLLAEMLEEMGHDVCAIEETEDGAVASATLQQPDLMIVDAWLGAGSGIAAVDKIQSARRTPHFFVSGDISRVRRLRPNSIIVQKPYREAEIANAIQRAIDSRP